MKPHLIHGINAIFSVDSLINQKLMAQRRVLPPFLNQKGLALVRGYVAEQVFHLKKVENQANYGLIYLYLKYT